MKGSRSSQPKDLSKPLQNTFKNPSKTFQQGVEIDDALGFPGSKKSVPGCGGPLAGHESLDACSVQMSFKEKTDKEIQHRRHIADTETIAGAGAAFADAVSWDIKSSY